VEKEMPHDLKGYVRPPVPIPTELRQSGKREVKLPAAIRAFALLCFVRAGVDLVFALLVGLAPKSTAGIFVASTFGDRFPHVPAEAEFFIFAFLFAFVGWRWIARDWRIRWVTMFLSGAIALRILVFVFADRASAAHGKILSTESELELGVIVAFNLLICGYLAFYPGMAQAFKETP
jgi:hypothetical protein